MTTPTDLPATDHTTGDLHLTHGASVREPEGMRRAHPGVVPLPDSARALLTGAGIDLEAFDAILDEVIA
jgi:hypothetical protein